MAAHVDGPTPSRITVLLALSKQLFYHQLILMVRYPVNTLGHFITLFVLFSIIFFGGHAVAGPGFADSLGGIVMGFFLFTMVTVAYSALAWNVTREAQWGTLEQLFMSPHGFGRVLGVKTAVNLVMSVLWGFVLLGMMMVLTGRILRIDVITILPIVLFTLLSVVGIGFVFAGLALLFKRIENIFQLVNFGFVGLIAAPATGESSLYALPVTQGSSLLFRAMNDGVRLWEFSAVELSILIVVGVGYMIAGYGVFLLLLRRARRQGVMGHY